MTSQRIRVLTPEQGVQRWRANTPYLTGQPVLNPSGQMRVARADFTSGATYSEANWTDPMASGYAMFQRITTATAATQPRPTTNANAMVIWMGSDASHPPGNYVVNSDVWIHS